MINKFELDKLSIINVAKDLGLELMRSGSNHFCRCIYHDEKTPSLSFKADKNFFHCFSCEKGGDIITLVQDKLHLDFVEACKYLEDMYGIKLYEKSKNYQKHQKQKKDLEDLNETYQKAFYGSKAYEYATTRGISLETAKEFGLGYGVKTTKEMFAYEDRLILPIHRHNGDLCGFGGRILEKSKLAKYINSKNDNGFDKSKLLYALHLAKHEIKRHDECIVVEGYLDTILAHQKGYKNVVAPLGVALNEFHINSLNSYTKNITLCFDNDDAGANATFRTIKKMVKNLEFFKVMLLPKDYKDFGEYMLDENANLKNLKKEDALVWACEYILKDFENDSKDKNQIKLNELNAFLMLVDSAYLKECAKEELLKRHSYLKSFYFKADTKKLYKNTSFSSSVKSSVEATLIYLMLQKNSNYEYVKSNIKPEFMRDFRKEYEMALTNSIDEDTMRRVFMCADDKTDVELAVGLKLKEYVTDRLSYLNERLKANLGSKLTNTDELIKRVMYYQNYLKQLNTKFGLN